MTAETREFVDRLRRALDMEEAMVNMLVPLAEPDALPEALSGKDREKVRAGLLTVRDDSMRHARIVGEMIRRLSKGGTP